MRPLSFMLANYAARPANYAPNRTWAQNETATSAYFQPMKTFVERFEAYLKDVRALGFESIDMWQPILDPRWLTDDHLDAAVDLLDQYDLSVVSFAGWLGTTLDEFERTCEIAAALNCPALGGDMSAAVDDRGFVVDMLTKYGLKWAYENEVEKTPAEILQKIGADATDVIGVCFDTGWFGTHGYDAAEALRQIGSRLFHVHLKDVLRVGDHQSCRYGLGVVPLERCVRVLDEIGYQGAITVEHETGQGDPSEDCRANLELLKAWFA